MGAKNPAFEVSERPAAALAPALTPHGRLHLAALEDAPAPRTSVGGCERPSTAGPATAGGSPARARSGRRCPPSSLTAGAGVAVRHRALHDARGGRRRRARRPRRPRARSSALAAAAPPTTGAEHLTDAVLASLWDEMAAAFHDERLLSHLGTLDLLKRWSPTWNLVGRVHFDLAENRKDDEAPFAFLATYTSCLSAHGKAQHLPLGQALREYAGEAKRDRLLSLLLPVQRGALTCPWLKAMVDVGEIFHPLRFAPREAFTTGGRSR